ncbi:inositol polyphosphate kinase-domain-containing protein [Podospora appendiculata]|uniref:Kinase n=1 Tax=Podospora appendiculata TaxID=314037 RepID=A0AAE0X9L5_9PEZI|nr:inositol polyphosphate kinase-domain-containing protein [Podospora appendiculata]
MLNNRLLPNYADLQPYNFAVAGHEGTLCDPDGELFIKPCTQQEIEFYESANKDHKPFADLMPIYVGTLSLNDVTNMQSLNEQLPAAAEHISMEMKEEALRMAKEAAEERKAEIKAKAAAKHDNVKWVPNKTRKISTNKSVVLENAAYGFTRPNILDAKLGSRLWADDAPLEKRQRFDEISKVTTNGSHGFRVAGMRVYKGSENPAEWDSEGYVVYDKDYGRLQVTRENVVNEMRKFIFNPQSGVDEDLGKAIAGAFVEDLKHVERVLANEESRMYSASLLFTFEGDGETLRAAIEQSIPSSTSSQREKKEKPGNMPGLSAFRVDSGIVLDDDGELIVSTGEGEIQSGGIALSDSERLILSPIDAQGKVLDYGNGANFTTEVVEMEGEDEDDDDDDDMSTLPRIYSLKLIDFAHAEWVPGQGPDENCLFGVRSLIKIFEELSQ